MSCLEQSLPLCPRSQSHEDPCTRTTSSKPTNKKTRRMGSSMIASKTDKLEGGSLTRKASSKAQVQMLRAFYGLIDKRIPIRAVARTERQTSIQLGGSRQPVRSTGISKLSVWARRSPNKNPQETDTTALGVPASHDLLGESATIEPGRGAGVLLGNTPSCRRCRKMVVSETTWSLLVLETSCSQRVQGTSPWHVPHSHQ